MIAKKKDQAASDEPDSKKQSKRSPTKGATSKAKEAVEKKPSKRSTSKGDTSKAKEAAEKKPSKRSSTKEAPSKVKEPAEKKLPKADERSGGDGGAFADEGGVRMAIDAETVTRLAESYANDVRRVLPVRRAFLFGSHAKGTATAQSDVDVCFFLDSYGGKRRVDIIKDLLGLTHAYKGVFFEPIAFTADDLQDDNPFVKEILRTGREIQ
jgi:predicted nucleotidyltransferase